MAAGLPSDEAPVGACHREASNSGGAHMLSLFNPVQNRQVQQKTKQLPLQFKLIMAAAFLSFILLTSCTMDPNGWMNIYFPDEGGAEVILQWDPNIEPDLAGYKIYYGTSSGIYNKSIDVGDTTLFTVKGLEFDTTYFFSATAYNIYGGESNFADEIIFFTPEEGSTI